MSTGTRWNRVFKALANPMRRQILDALKARPMTTGELCQRLRRLDRCTVMLHLNVLEASGLVLVRREGRMRWNYLNVAPIQEIFNRWISIYAVPSVDLLMRLKEDLEMSPTKNTARKTAKRKAS